MTVVAQARRNRTPSPTRYRRINPTLSSWCALWPSNQMPSPRAVVNTIQVSIRSPSQNSIDACRRRFPAYRYSSSSSSWGHERSVCSPRVRLYCAPERLSQRKLHPLDADRNRYFCTSSSRSQNDAQVPDRYGCSATKVYVVPAHCTPTMLTTVVREA